MPLRGAGDQRWQQLCDPFPLTAAASDSPPTCRGHGDCRGVGQAGCMGAFQLAQRSGDSLRIGGRPPASNIQVLLSFWGEKGS